MNKHLRQWKKNPSSLMLIVGVVIVGIVFLFTLQNRTSENYDQRAFSQTAVTPTFYCAGPESCITENPSPTVAILSGIPTTGNETPTINADTPTGVDTMEPTTDPCIANTVSIQTDGHHGHKKSNEGSIGEFMNLFIELLKQLIALIEQLLGGAPSTPSDPQPTGEPIPTETETEPTNAIEPTSNPCPPTTVPTQTGETPTAGPTIGINDPTPTTAGGTNTTGPTAPSTQFKNLIFEDQFEGTTINTSNWSLYSGEGNAGIGTRDPSADTVKNGELLITGKGDVSGGMSLNKPETYGLFEIRAKMDKGNGYGPAIMLWPMSGGDGVCVCIAEIPKGDRAESVFTMHGGGKEKGFSSTGDFSQWHVFSAEWSAGEIKYYLDGKLEHTFTPAEVPIPTIPLSVVLQNDVGAAGQWIPGRDATTPAEVSLHVDWVRIYK